MKTQSGTSLLPRRSRLLGRAAICVSGGVWVALALWPFIQLRLFRASMDEAAATTRRLNAEAQQAAVERDVARRESAALRIANEGLTKQRAELQGKVSALQSDVRVWDDVRKEAARRGGKVASLFEKLRQEAPEQRATDVAQKIRTCRKQRHWSECLGIANTWLPFRAALHTNQDERALVEIALLWKVLGEEVGESHVVEGAPCHSPGECFARAEALLRDVTSGVTAAEMPAYVAGNFGTILMRRSQYAKDAAEARKLRLEAADLLEHAGAIDKASRDWAGNLLYLQDKLLVDDSDAMLKFCRGLQFDDLKQRCGEMLWRHVRSRKKDLPRDTYRAAVCGAASLVGKDHKSSKECLRLQ